jgi:hypothetical protein
MATGPTPQPAVNDWITITPGAAKSAVPAPAPTAAPRAVADPGDWQTVTPNVPTKPDPETEAAKYFRIGAHILGAPVEGLLNIPRQLLEWGKNGFKTPTPPGRFQTTPEGFAKNDSLPMGFDEPITNAYQDAVMAATPAAAEGAKAAPSAIKRGVSAAAEHLENAPPSSVGKLLGRGAGFLAGKEATGSFVGGYVGADIGKAVGGAAGNLPGAIKAFWTGVKNGDTSTPGLGDPRFDPGAPVEFTPAPPAPPEPTGSDPGVRAFPPPAGPIAPASSPMSGTGSPYTPPGMDPGVSVSRVPADQLPIAPRNAAPAPKPPLIDRLSQAVASAPNLEDTKLLDDIAKAQTKKSFKSLSPADQETVRSIAIRMEGKTAAAPSTPGPATTPAATPPPPAAVNGEAPNTITGLSRYTDSGELKSPEVRGAEIKQANIEAKGQRFSQALKKYGISSADYASLPDGTLTPAQIKISGVPGKGNITQVLIKQGFLNPDEVGPNESIPRILFHLQRLEAMDAVPKQ